VAGIVVVHVLVPPVPGNVLTYTYGNTYVVFADPVGAMASQSRLPPDQFVSVTVSVLPGDPVVGLALSAAPTGAGVTVSVALFDTHPVAGHGVGFVTCTGTDPAAATSPACTLMSS
jgi:hypothetical protein